MCPGWWARRAAVTKPGPRTLPPGLVQEAPPLQDTRAKEAVFSLSRASSCKSPARHRTAGNGRHGARVEPGRLGHGLVVAVRALRVRAPVCTCIYVHMHVCMHVHVCVHVCLPRLRVCASARVCVLTAQSAHPTTSEVPEMQEADAGGARSLPGPHSRPSRARVTAQRLRHCRGVGPTVAQLLTRLTAACITWTGFNSTGLIFSS